MVAPSRTAEYQRLNRKSRIKSSADLGAVIAEALEDFGAEITDLVDEAGEQTAEECARLIRNSSPGFNGKAYLRDWTSKKQDGKRYMVQHVVYNKNHYRLTHLLEFGHATRNGGRTREFPHIAPVNQKAGEIFQRIFYEEMM